MDISAKQQRTGAAYGAVAFVLGAAIAWWVVSPEPQDPTRAQRALWVYLSAHFKTVGPLRVAAVVENFPRLSLLASGNRPAIWYAVPILVSALGAVGANISMGGTKDGWKMLQNSVTTVGGYVPIALLAMVWGRATPTLGAIIIVLALGILALFVGSTVVGSATATVGQRGRGVPVIGFTSLGSLALIGGVVLLVGFVALRIVIPIAVTALGGALLGTVFIYAGREFDP